MPVDDATLREACKDTLRTQTSALAHDANVFAPVYRQMNIAALGDDITPEVFDQLNQPGTTDVRGAFDYYLKHLNKGRPFILAGHSQGSKQLLELMLAKWGGLGVEEQLVAAYIVGWSVTGADLQANPALRICESAEQSGCLITYNTTAPGAQSKAPTLRPDSRTVNPLSWTTTTEHVPASRNLGAAFLKNDSSTPIPHFADAQIVGGAVVTVPKDLALVTPDAGVFPKGVYHKYDYALFYENLKSNVATRIKAWRAQQ